MLGSGAVGVQAVHQASRCPQGALAQSSAYALKEGCRSRGSLVRSVFGPQDKPDVGGQPHSNPEGKAGPCAWRNIVTGEQNPVLLGDLVLTLGQSHTEPVWIPFLKAELWNSPNTSSLHSSLNKGVHFASRPAQDKVSAWFLQSCPRMDARCFPFYTLTSSLHAHPPL